MTDVASIPLKRSGSLCQHGYVLPTKADWTWRDGPVEDVGDKIICVSNVIYERPRFTKSAQAFAGFLKKAEPCRDISNFIFSWPEHPVKAYSNLSHQHEEMLQSILAIVKAGCIFEEQPSVVETLDAQAKANAVWTEDDMAELSDWVAKNRTKALHVVKDGARNGRLRWAVLEALAGSPTDTLRAALCQLAMDHELDRWLLNGVPVVIRMTAMGGKYRSRVAKALREHLIHVGDHPNKYREHVTECGVGELVMTFGSFAEPADFELVGGFAFDEWKLKVRVCAFDSLRRMTLRFAEAEETNRFYEANFEKLMSMGKAWAANFRTSADDGALFFAWLTTVLSRLGPEADMVQAILQEYPRHTARVRYELKQMRNSVVEKSPEIQSRFERLYKLAQTAGKH